MANEIQRLYWNSQSSPSGDGEVEDGTFKLAGFSADFTGDLAHNITASELQTALEGLGSIGSGNIVVTDEVDGFSWEFQNALANTNLALISVQANSLKRKADTVTISTTSSGSDPNNETQQLDFGGATTGSFSLNGNSTFQSISSFDSFGLQTALDSIWGFGNTTVSGSGPYNIEFISTYAGSDINEMYISDNTTDGNPTVSTITQGSIGQFQTVQITCDDGPTEGQVSVTLGGDSGSFNCTDASPSITGWNLISGSTNSWSFTRQVAGNDVFISATEGSPELRKDCPIEIVVVQEGSGGGGGSTGAGLLQSTKLQRVSLVG